MLLSSENYDNQMGKHVDTRGNRIKFITHGFFFSSAIHVAEPSTILPLMIQHFSSNNVLIGLFSSLVRGGAVLMQLYMAYFAQAFTRVMKPLRLLFMFRFISWFCIGLSLYFIGDKNPTLTLWMVGIGLFFFSFVAGFGTVLFHELLGKIFTNKYRGVTWAYRQFFMAVGGILSAFFTAYLFHKYRYDKTHGFAMAFLISAAFMAVGYFFLGSVKEDVKKNVSKKESSFLRFLSNSFGIIRDDKKLALQILVCLLSFTYLLVFPFIVKFTKLEISIAGKALGSAFPLLCGNILGNLLWGRFSSKGNDKIIIQLSFAFMVASLVVALFANQVLVFATIFLLAGVATDGFRLSFKNLVLSIAPEEKRPVYFAVQNNMTSLGMFFSIPGGWLLNHFSLHIVTLLSILLLVFGFVLSMKLKNAHE